jgi:hypothetical protein
MAVVVAEEFVGESGRTTVTGHGADGFEDNKFAFEQAGF